jgi:hypothetical protein
MFYTYVHTRNDTNKVFYVGKGVKYRANAKGSRNAYWHNIVNKYGHKVEILAYWDTEEEALSHERLLIACFADMGYELANLTEGGETSSPCQETKDKIAKALTGRKRTLMERQNMSIGQRNKVISPEQKAEIAKKVSAKLKGIKRSEDFKEKMRARKQSDSSRAKISESLKAYWQKRKESN